MIRALEDGSWDPCDARDPWSALQHIQADLSPINPAIDLAHLEDLVAIALGAMEAGEWSDVSEGDISDVQRLNFLSRLAGGMVPQPAIMELML